MSSTMRFMGAILLAVVATAANAMGQEQTGYQVDRLADHIYKLSVDAGGYAVKVIASVGSDGILLVDTGEKDDAESLVATLATLGEGAPRIIINTHAHVEHTGGNAIFKGAPLIIGQRNLRATMRSGSYLFDETPDYALPSLLFDDSLTLFFNGEEIRLLAFPGAHDNSDIVVWFVGSKIACVAALSNGTHFPSVDGVTGDVRRYPEVVEKLIRTLPDDVLIVPGHGEDHDKAGLLTFHRMLVRTAEIVRDGLAQGKDLATLQQDDVLSEFSSYEGSYTSKNRWIQYLVDGSQPRRTLRQLCEPLYYALKEGGAEQAVAEYYKLKADHLNEYRFGEMQLLIVPYKLMLNGRYADALPFVELHLKEYPDGPRAWLAHYVGGRACFELGDRRRAKQYFEESLKLNPDNEEVEDYLRQLSEGD